MTTGQLAEDYADVVSRLLVRVYEIHERVLTRGGGAVGGYHAEGTEEAAQRG
jgi:hypothetical protein